MKIISCLIILLSIPPGLRASDSRDLREEVIGHWTCENMGDFFEYGFTQPAEIEFTSDGRYIETMIYHGHTLINSGSYRIYRLSGHLNIEQTVIKTSGEGWEDYIRNINHANA